MAGASGEGSHFCEDFRPSGAASVDPLFPGCMKSMPGAKITFA